MQDDSAACAELGAAYSFIVVGGGQRIALGDGAAVVGAAVYGRDAVDVAPGLQGHGLACAHLCGGQVDVVAGGQHHAAGALHGGAEVGDVTAALEIAVVGGGVGAVGERLRAQGEGVAGHQLGHAIGAGIANLRGLQVDVAASHHRQHAVAVGAGDIQAGHARELGGAVLVEAAALECFHSRGNRDIAGRLHAQGIDGGDAGAFDADVAGRAQPHLVTADAAAQVLDAAGVDGHQLAAGNGAGVLQVAGQGDIDIGAGQQCAASFQIAGTQTQIDLRHECGGGAAIGQGDGLLHQPDDVAGELGHLRIGQRNART